MNLINIYNHKRKIYLFCRDDKGNLIIDQDNSFFPYYYDYDENGKFETIYGEKVKKVFVPEPSDVPKSRANNSYEADILFTKRYMIDKVTKLDKCPIKYAFIDIEVLANELPNVQQALQPISCISIYNSLYKTIQTWYLGDYKDEIQMVDNFVNYMKQEKFDLWLSWNVKFDYNYLYNRMESLKFLDKRNFGELISPIGKSRYGDGEVFYPAGISIVDYLQWDKKVTLNRRKSYSLDNVAQEELKDKPNEKIEFGKLNPKIKEKNINDIERMVKLEAKLKYIDYFDEIRRLTKVEWEDIQWNSRIIDILLLQEAKEKKIVLPMKPAEERGTLEDKAEYQGAYREAFKTGRFETVGVYDLGSAYPSMIIDFCLDPANIEKENYDKALNIEGTYFKQNPDTLLPIVTKKLITLKKDIKKKLSTLSLDSQEYKDIYKKYDAIKSIVNSAYGVFGNRFFRLYDNNVASATTFLVRDLLHYVQEKLEKQGHEIIYIDTDGIMINNNKEDISNLLNDLVKQWAKEKYNKDNVSIEFGYEGYFNPIIILTKCRYKGWLVTNKGIEPKTKGIEAKRKDSTIYMKKFQNELLDKIKNNEPKENIFNWIKQEIKELPNQPLKEIAFPCKLAKNPEDYKNTPIFVRALNNTPEFDTKIGSNFYYIYVKPIKEQGVKTIIKIKNNFEKELISYQDIILDENLSRKEGIEYAKKQYPTLNLETSKISVLHKKEKPADVMAFNEDNYNHITKDMIDWDRIIERNILMKLDTIFEAMGWDLKRCLNTLKEPLKSCQNKLQKHEQEQNKGMYPPKIKENRANLTQPIENKEDKSKFAEEVSKETCQTSSLKSRVQVPNSAPIIKKEYDKIQEAKSQTKEIENFKLEDLVIKQLDFKTTKEYIKENHYSHTISSSVKVSVGFFYKDKLVTAIVYGCPVGRRVTRWLQVNYDNCLELIRLFSIDGLPKNTESYCIAKSFDFLKLHYPQYKYLISYADPNHGHVGYIYQATNWRYVGIQRRLMKERRIYIDGKEVHARALNSKHGSTSEKKLQEIYGDRLKIKEALKKHVYLMCLGNKKEKREWYKKFPEQKYPKVGGEIK